MTSISQDLPDDNTLLPLVGSPGNDEFTFVVDSGSDSVILTGESGPSLSDTLLPLVGSPGNDGFTYVGDSGDSNITLTASTGNDLITVTDGSGSDFTPTITASTGNDLVTVTGGSGSDFTPTITGGSGSDLITPTITGSSGSDLITPTLTFDDIITSPSDFPVRDRDWSIYGGKGEDILPGGNESSSISGGSATDPVVGDENPILYVSNTDPYPSSSGTVRRIFHEHLIVRDILGYDDSVTITSFNAKDPSQGTTQKLSLNEWKFTPSESLDGIAETEVTLSNGVTETIRFYRTLTGGDIDIQAVSSINSRTTPLGEDLSEFLGVTITNEDGTVRSGITESQLLTGIYNENGTKEGLSAEVFSIRSGAETDAISLTFETYEVNGEKLFVFDEYVNNVDRILFDYTVDSSTDSIDPLALTGFFRAEEQRTGSTYEQYTWDQLSPVSPSPQIEAGTEGVDFWYDGAISPNFDQDAFWYRGAAPLEEGGDSKYWFKFKNTDTTDELTGGGEYALVATKRDALDNGETLDSLTGEYVFSKSFASPDGIRLYAGIDEAAIQELSNFGAEDIEVYRWDVAAGQIVGTDGREILGGRLDNRFRHHR